MKGTIKRCLIFSFLISFSLGSCSLFPGDDSPSINDPVPNANGMYIPESCIEQRDSLTLIGELELPEAFRVENVIGYYDEEQGKEYAFVHFDELLPGNSTPQAGIYFVDITDPENPSIINSLREIGEGVSDMSVWKNYLYLSFDSHNISIFDISDLSNPQKAGQFDGGLHLSISENGYLYLNEPGITVFDIGQNPIEPKKIWNHSYNGQGNDVVVFDNRVFAFQDVTGTIFFDSSNPHELDQIRILNSDSVTSHFSGWPSSSDEYINIIDESSEGGNDISIMNVNTGEFIGGFSFEKKSLGATNLYTICNRMVVSLYYDGLRLFDVSDPTQLVLLDDFDLPLEGESGPWHIFPFTESGNILATNARTKKGLYILRIK